MNAEQEEMESQEGQASANCTAEISGQPHSSSLHLKNINDRYILLS